MGKENHIVGTFDGLNAEEKKCTFDLNNDSEFMDKFLHSETFSLFEVNFPGQNLHFDTGSIETSISLTIKTTQDRIGEVVEGTREINPEELGQTEHPKLMIDAVISHPPNA